MRLLLDESLPRRLAPMFIGHEVVTVAEAGWSGLTNGQLLGVAQHEFDCLVTVDRSLVFQQSMPHFTIAVLVMRARTNRLADLAPLEGDRSRLADADGGDFDSRGAYLIRDGVRRAAAKSDLRR